MGKANGSLGEALARPGSTSVELRRLDASDAGYRARYAAECDGVAEDAEVRRIERRMLASIRRPDYLGVVALDGGRRIGHVDGDVRGTRLVVGDIYVEKAYRCRGIGERLLEAIIALASQRGVTVVEFCTEADNLPMQRAGKRLGFNLTQLHFERRVTD